MEYRNLTRLDIRAYLPSVLPRCCVGSSLSERLVDSLWRRRTPWTPAPRTLHPRCSHPTSSPPRAVPCGGNRSRTWWTCPRRRSASLQTPRLLKRWRGRTLTLWLLRETDEDRWKEKRERESVNLVLNMDKAIFTAANIQTEVLKGIAPGDNLLTQHFIFEICEKQEAYGKKHLLSNNM